MTPKARPTEWVSVAAAILALAAAFGLQLSKEQTAAIMGFVSVVLVPTVTWLVARYHGNRGRQQAWINTK